MTLTRKEQSTLLDLLSKGFENVKHHNPGAWEGWQFVKDFDRHSPCANMCIVTPNQSEIKIFTPNNTSNNLDNEEFCDWIVWFDVFGMYEEDTYEEFDSSDDIVGYLLEQWESDNL